MVMPFLPGLEPQENVTLGSVGASAWRAGGGEFAMEFWPRKAASLVTMNPPVTLGEWQLNPEPLSCAILRLADAADRADADAARTLGQAALAVAAAAGGVLRRSAAVPDARAEDLNFRRRYRDLA